MHANDLKREIGIYMSRIYRKGLLALVEAWAAPYWKCVVLLCREMLQVKLGMKNLQQIHT